MFRYNVPLNLYNEYASYRRRLAVPRTHLSYLKTAGGLQGRDLGAVEHSENNANVKRQNINRRNGTTIPMHLTNLNGCLFRSISSPGTPFLLHNIIGTMVDFALVDSFQQANGFNPFLDAVADNSVRI